MINKKFYSKNKINIATMFSIVDNPCFHVFTIVPHLKKGGFRLLENCRVSLNRAT
jgi:hypothetical protein